MTPDEALLREMLWIRHDQHHFSALYGDDGEMQCAVCGIDFKRWTVKEIQDAFIRIALTKLAKKEPLQCPESPPPKV